jgi:hypothetical protein
MTVLLIHENAVNYNWGRCVQYQCHWILSSENVSVCTNGILAMTKWLKEFVARLKQDFPHCLIYHEAVMANTTQIDQSVLNFVSKMADYIKFQAFRDGLYYHAQFVYNNTDNRNIYSRPSPFVGLCIALLLICGKIIVVIFMHHGVGPSLFCSHTV